MFSGSRDQFYCGFLEDKDVAGYVRTWHKRAQFRRSVAVSARVITEEAVRRLIWEAFVRRRVRYKVLGVRRLLGRKRRRIAWWWCGIALSNGLAWRRDSSTRIYFSLREGLHNMLHNHSRY